MRMVLLATALEPAIFFYPEADFGLYKYCVITVSSHMYLYKVRALRVSYFLFNSLGFPQVKLPRFQIMNPPNEQK